MVPAGVDPSPPQDIREIPYLAVDSIASEKAVFLLRVCSDFSKYSYMYIHRKQAEEKHINLIEVVF